MARRLVDSNGNVTGGKVTYTDAAGVSNHVDVGGRVPMGALDTVKAGWDGPRVQQSAHELAGSGTGASGGSQLDQEEQVRASSAVASNQHAAAADKLKDAASRVNDPDLKSTIMKAAKDHQYAAGAMSSLSRGGGATPSQALAASQTAHASTKRAANLSRSSGDEPRDSRGRWITVNGNRIHLNS